MVCSREDDGWEVLGFFRYSEIFGWRACAISFRTEAFLSSDKVGFIFSNCCHALTAPLESFFACRQIIPRLKRELASLGS